MENKYTRPQNTENQEIESRFQDALGEFATYYDGVSKPEPLFLYEEELNRLVRLQRAKKMQPRLTVIRGAKESGRKFMLRHLAYAAKTSVLFVDCAGFMGKYAEYGTYLTRLLLWKVNQLQCFFCICGRESTEEDMQQWERFLSEITGSGFSCFITIQDKGAVPYKTGCELIEIELKNPGLEDRAVLWAHFLSLYNVEPCIDAEVLSGRYFINAGTITQILKTAELHRQSYGRELLSGEDISKAAETVSPGTMGGYAKEVPCVFSWEDLVVDENLHIQLQNICNQVKFRNIVGERWGFYEKRPYGNGTCVLFHGPPGTGKTMAAQVVAGELGLPLYRVDLSRMNSKYIGETQKNISTLFQHARERNVILFFDEADAIFSRRTQVKDANDRHANSETAHLLQELEDYEGVTILATNLRTQIDDAFKRRIKMMAGFRLPDKETRKKLWRKALPEKAPVEADLNLNFFAAKFEISGSEIKEIMLDAAFLAAAEHKKIGMPHVMAALKECYEKYGRVLSREELEVTVTS